jgi:Vitamin B6 photo-protection and homoeostasis
MVSKLRIREIDESGHPKVLYVAHGADSFIDRVETIQMPNSIPLARRLLGIFLPTGYPSTVSPDYTAYHVYNALQAFSSSIASLLAARAVLQGLGVGDENASATNAMLLNVLQESMGRMATILFAHRVGSAIQADCKMYRFLADVLNDAAMVSDCLSPMLHKLIRVPLLGTSSVFRALCGVASGSSKATLSAHFARGGNIGELNATDSSQETIVSLMGMWVGGVVVSYATTTIATWTWLLVLLIAHLSTNYFAVRSVNMRSINSQRANIIFSSLIENGHAPDPGEVAKLERVFEKSSTLRWNGSKLMGTCEIGVSFTVLLRQLGEMHPKTRSARDLHVNISDLLQIFSEEQYLLWIDVGKKRALIVLIEKSTTETQLRAWAHALRAMRALEHRKEINPSGNNVLRLLRSAMIEQSAVFEDWIKQLEANGWILGAPAMETSGAKRIAFER